MDKFKIQVTTNAGMKAKVSITHVDTDMTWTLQEAEMFVADLKTAVDFAKKVDGLNK